MKNLLTSLGMAALLAVGISAQSTTGVRPRVAPTATPTIKNDSQTQVQPQQQPGGPPVLQRGGVRPSTAPTPTTSQPAKTTDDSDEVVKVETNLVTMPVSVLDREGRFIAGLQQKDFKIFE